MIWAALGFSAGIIGLFCITLAEFAAEKPFFETHRDWISIGLAAFSAALALMGHFKTKQNADPATSVKTGTDADEPSPRFALFGYHYWAAIILAASLTVLFVCPWRTVRIAPTVAAKPLVRPPIPAVASPPPAKPAPVVPEPRPMPKLKLQGIFYRKSQPSVIINGNTFHQAEHRRTDEHSLAARIVQPVRAEPGSIRWAPQG